MADDPEFSDAEDDLEYTLEGMIPSYRWSREQVTADTLEFASKIAAAASEYLETMSGRAAAESNYKIDQRDAADAARREIEQITMTPTQEGPDA